MRVPVIVAALAAVGLAGLAAACSGGGPASEGTLTGHLYGVGGPAPGLPRPWPGTVTVAGAGIHRDIPVGADGAYAVTVSPGRYSVTGYSPRYSGICRAAGTVRVIRGQSTRADVLCQMT
jgi:hypothetical protein